MDAYFARYICTKGTATVTDFEQSQSEERMQTLEIDLVIDQIPNL